MKVLCVGCSWTRDWPKFLPDYLDVTHEWRDGKGITTLHDVVKEQGGRHDAVIVQLPTPIRWDRSPWYSRQFIAEFLKRTRGGDPQFFEQKLLDSYYAEMWEISRCHPRVLFLLFNTGGYPFRAPYDFGAEVTGQLYDTCIRHYLSLIPVTLQGHPGFCKGEEALSDQPPSDVSVIHPGGRFVTDPHPNDAACRIAASRVLQWIQSHETVPVS